MVTAIKLTHSTSIDLKQVLVRSGQVFRWSEADEYKWHTGVFGDRVWKVRHNDNKSSIQYQVIGRFLTCCTSYDHQDKRDFVNYLALKAVDVESLCQNWETSSDFVKSIFENNQLLRNSGHDVGNLRRMRILNQDPWECLLQFLITQNNNIKRIQECIEKLCYLYGEKINDINGKSYYNYPKIEALITPDVEGTLRAAKFGYRAAYIVKIAERLQSLGGRAFLNSLHAKSMSSNEARNELTKFYGIGMKVADCVLLMSLGHHNIVPIDTHMKTIAQQMLLIKDCRRSMSKDVYIKISEAFETAFGSYAGWAQAILFANAAFKQSSKRPLANKHSKKVKRKIATVKVDFRQGQGIINHE